MNELFQARFMMGGAFLRVRLPFKPWLRLCSWWVKAEDCMWQEAQLVELSIERVES